VQEDTARRIDADRLELLGVFERVLDGLADLADLVVDAADVVVGDVRGLGDLHRLRPGVGLVVEHLLDREGIVDRDAVAGPEVGLKRRGRLRQHLLVVAVLFDDYSVIGDLLDGGDVQRGGLQHLVFAFQPVHVRLEFAAPVLRVIKSVLELIVHLQYPPVVLADRLEPLRLAHLRIEFQTRTVGQ